MDPLTALIGMTAISGLFGGLSSGVSAIEGHKQRKFAARQAEIQRNWMTEMSNTAHQREVQDLRAAGLNPILSAGGSGATVSGGASASAPSVPDTSQGILSAGLAIGNAIMSAVRLDNESKMTAAQVSKLQSEKTLTDEYVAQQQMINSLLPETMAAKIDSLYEDALSKRHGRGHSDREFGLKQKEYYRNVEQWERNFSREVRQWNQDYKLRKGIHLDNREDNRRYREALLNVMQRGQNVDLVRGILNLGGSLVPKATP